jgi:Tetratricopeptide repeat
VNAASAMTLALVLAVSGASAQSRRGRGGGGGQGTSPGGTAGSDQGGRGGGGVAGQPGKYHLQPLNLHKQTLGTEGFAAAARARMRDGDCVGALDGFDLALRSSIDPTLNRDRGLCQERLGNPYPAIDDYRTYVTADPDAPDAEGIRERLQRLEMDVYKHSSETPDGPDDGPYGGSTSGMGATTAGTSGMATTTVTVGDGDSKRDAMESVEHDQDDLSSSLRAGKGFGLAPFFSEHKWITPGSSFGDSNTWSESAGLQIRYSVSSRSAFFLEGGWELFNSTQGVTISGLTSQLGYELRIPVDERYKDQLLLGLGLGYEHLVATSTDPSRSSQSGGAFVPRVRVGWRHMLTTSVGLDLSLDGGITGKALSQGSFLTGDGSQPAEIVAANLAVVWGL